MSEGRQTQNKSIILYLIVTKAMRRKQARQRVTRCKWWVGAILNRMVKKGFSEKVKFEQKTERSEPV